MKTSLRVFLSVATFLGSYVLCFFVLVIALPDTLSGLLVPVSLLVAGFLAFRAWRGLADGMPESPLAWSALGAIVVGLGGFLLGFVGPMLFAPGANQGPMLGIFITGPLGLLVGAVGGFILGLRKHVTS